MFTIIHSTEKKEKHKEDDPTKSKRKKTSASGCPFYTAGQMDTFKYRVALQVLDVEQLLSIGKELKACPYYGTRYTIPSAEVGTKKLLFWVKKPNLVKVFF